MEEQHTQSADHEQHQAMVQGFLGVVEQELRARHGPERAADLLLAIHAGRAEQIERHTGWLVDEASRAHLDITALVLAAYRVLQPMLPPDELLALIRQAFIEPLRPLVQQFTAAALDGAPDPHALMVAVSKEREQHYYGGGFSFERQQDDAHAYLLNITRCFYHRFFLANGAPELARLFCAWDANWFEAIDPARHGFGFERPTTLAYGGDACRFWFIRRAPREAGA